MLGFEIIGTGHHVPGRPVKNEDLSRVMDTDDDWIFKRSGIRQPHFECPVTMDRAGSAGNGGEDAGRNRADQAGIA